MAEKLDKALRLREDGDLEGATDALGKIIDAEGEDQAEAWLRLAETWEERKDPETAVNAYREALTLDLGENEALGRLGLARAHLAAGHPREAIGVIDDTEVDDDPDLVELARKLRRKASRTIWVLQVGRRYLTRYELALSVLGLLCAASTLLPWLAVTYQGGAASRTGWQLGWVNPALVCGCALVLVFVVVRMAGRRLHWLWTAIVAAALSVVGVVGVVRTGLLVWTVIAPAAQSWFFQYPNVESVRPHVGLYVTAALVLLHLVVAVAMLLKDTPRSPAHVR